MLVRILKTARIHHFPGQTVEVTDPAELNFLLSTGSAEVLRAAAPETPEDGSAAEARQTTARKTARKK